jgi:hypothetical protein
VNAVVLVGRFYLSSSTSARVKRCQSEAPAVVLFLFTYQKGSLVIALRKRLLVNLFITGLFCVVVGGDGLGRTASWAQRIARKKRFSIRFSPTATKAVGSRRMIIYPLLVDSARVPSRCVRVENEQPQHRRQLSETRVWCNHYACVGFCSTVVASILFC